MEKFYMVLQDSDTIPETLKFIFWFLGNSQPTMSFEETKELRSIANILMSFIPCEPHFEVLLNRREKIEPITRECKIFVVIWMMRKEMVTELQKFYEMYEQQKLDDALECVLAFLQESHALTPEHTASGVWEIPETSIRSLPPSLTCVERTNRQVISHLKFAPGSKCWKFQRLIAEQLSELPIRKQINEAFKRLELSSMREVIFILHLDHFPPGSKC